MYLDAAVVAYKTEPAKTIHKKADTGTGGPDHIRQRFLGNRRNEGIRLAWVRMLRASRNLRNISANAGSSCIARIISLLLILSAVQLLTAVAVAKCNPTMVARDSSPTKSLAARRVIVASLPFFETTVTLARPFCR